MATPRTVRIETFIAPADVAREQFKHDGGVKIRISNLCSQETNLWWS